MKTYSRSGQAAIEFLTTYGWAILGVMVAIGALTYFGIFNPSRYLTDQCNFGDQLKCEDSVAYANNVSIILRNNFGVSINVSLKNTNITYEDIDYQCNQISVGTSTYTCTPNTNSCILEPGQRVRIDCSIATLLTPEDKIRIKAKVGFHRHPTGADHIQTGDIYTTVSLAP